MKCQRILAGMRCDKAQRLFIGFVNDQLDEEKARRLQAHLYACPACFSLYSMCKKMAHGICEAVGVTPPAVAEKWTMEKTQPSPLHQLLEKLENE